MSESDGKLRLSFIDDEEIEIKPSTELIPDEYERADNANMLVELICRKTDEEAIDLADELKNLGFFVNKNIVEGSTVNDNWISTFVAEVNDKIKQKNYDGLLMIFAKLPLRNEVLKNTWGNFTSIKCPALKNKPKIFIFQIYKRGPSVDFLFQTPGELKMTYDTPSEADILIVYDKTSLDSSSDFLENFHGHIKDYSRQEDIVNLVSLSIGSESRPLIISTMTRKFFFTINQYRGHHHNINENHTEIKENLEKIMHFVKNNPDHKPKDKEKGIMNSVRRTLNSFKSKNRKESGNGEKKVEDNEEATKLGYVKEEKSTSEPQKQSNVKKGKAEADSSKGKPQKLKLPTEPIMGPPTNSPTRKASTSNIPTPIRRSSVQRSRYPSGTFGSKEDLAQKKPAWR